MTRWKSKPHYCEQHTNLLLVVPLQSGKQDYTNICDLTWTAVQTKPDWKRTFFSLIRTILQGEW